MDEEQSNKKIDINSFFDRADKVEEVANKALKQSSLSMNGVKANQTLINSISVSIEAMRTEIRDIANYIVIEKKLEKDAAEDRRFEEEDKAQKAKMDERLKALLPEKTQTVESPLEEKKGGGGFMSGLLKVIGGLGLIAGIAALATVALPVLGPILLGALGVGLVGLVIAKIGPPLVKWVKGMFNKIKNFLGNVFKPVEKIPVVGKSLSGMLKGGLVGGIGGVGSAVAGALHGALKGASGGEDGGNGGVTSNSNMNLENGKNVEKNLEKTLKKNGLVENKIDEDDINFKSEFKEGSYEFSSSEEDGVTSTSSKFEGTARFDLNSGKAYILGEEVTIEGYNEYINLPDKERFSKDGMMKIIEKHAVTKIEPESNNNKKELIQSFNKNSSTGGENTNSVDNLMKQKIIAQNNNINIPKNTSQVSAAEIKGTGTTVSYIRALSNQYLSIANNKLPPEIARMIQ